MTTHTAVTVTEIPDCDLCVKRPAPLNSPAYADAKMRGGGWANLCSSHFVLYGCSLGLGRGQEYIQRKEEA